MRTDVKLGGFFFGLERLSPNVLSSLLLRRFGK